MGVTEAIGDALEVWRTTRQPSRRHGRCAAKSGLGDGLGVGKGDKAQIRRRLNNPRDNLRLERQGGLPGGAGINQLDRMDALGLASVLEEEQSRLGESTVPFR